MLSDVKLWIPVINKYDEYHQKDLYSFQDCESVQINRILLI